MDPTKSGTQFGPIPQMCGTSTTQQGIYLNHNNPCGVNRLLYSLMGKTGLTFQQLADLLSEGLAKPESSLAFENLVDAFIAFNLDTTLQNQYKVYDGYFVYGNALWNFFQTIQIEGYKTHLSIYEENGRLMFDSDFLNWPLVYSLPNGDLAPTQLQLVPSGVITVNTFFYAPPPAPPFTIVPLTINETLNPTGTNSCNLYNLLKTPSFWPYIINVTNPVSGSSQIDIVNSPFMINHTQMFESTMAIASLLTDSANTRAYSALKFGFSARPVLPGTGQIGYYCCFLQQIFSQGESPYLIESFFVRIGLEREIS